MKFSNTCILYEIFVMIVYTERSGTQVQIWQINCEQNGEEILWFQSLKGNLTKVPTEISEYTGKIGEDKYLTFGLE